ncbi:MAG: ribosomal protein S18-alanine N-acetyltransferase [Deltaproteobacteria bacterium]|nr:ribosomal protein S18-alanine N-acetyltransferase [Deltaproteobacteria bacterium]
MATAPNKTLPFTFRPMHVEDLPSVLDIERRSFRAPWSAGTFLAEMKNEWARLRVAVDTRRFIVGYINYWLVADEVHLLNIATHPDSRQQGIARHLIEQMFDEGRSHGCRLVTLEVRVSNHAAIALYNSFGFETVAVRVKYYVEDNEDALVMVAPIDGPGPQI